MSISLVKTINLSGFAGFNFPGWIRSVETVLQWMQVIFRGCSFCLLHVFYVSDSACSRVRTTVVQSHITPAFTPSHIYTHTHSHRTANARTWHKYILYIFIAHNRKKTNIFIQSQSPLLEVILSCEPAAAFTPLICWLLFLIKESRQIKYHKSPRTVFYMNDAPTWK